MAVMILYCTHASTYIHVQIRPDLYMSAEHSLHKL